MAFCNSCGATLTPGIKFCNKCGAAVAAAPPAATAAPTPSPSAAAPRGGSSALKIVLIVVLVIVAIGVLGLATLGIIAYRVAKSTHLRQQGENVKVETPFGTVETSKDPEQAAKDLGVDIYPGAQVQKEGSTDMTLGNIHTVAAVFQTDDSVDKVCSFYKSRFPSAMATTADPNHCSLVSSDQRNMVTINIESSGDTTKIQITNVSKKSSN